MPQRLTRLLVALATLFAMTAAIAAQDNPRYARWKLKSDAPAPQSNIMTYEAYNGTGMKVTIDSVSRTGAESKWFYTTMFDGKDEPVTGRNGTATGAVKVITDRINEIVYKNAEGKITQILMNVLSPDNNTITVSYVSVDAQGNLRPPTYATYERMK